MKQAHHATPRLLAQAAIAIAVTAPSSDALAQYVVPPGIKSPTYSLIDVNGVNLTSFRPTAAINDIQIGPADNPLSHETQVATDGMVPTVTFFDSFNGKIQPSYNWDNSPNCAGSNMALDVYVGSSADRMCGTLGGSYIAQRSTGSFMVTNHDGTITFTRRDGTQLHFGIQRSSTAFLLTQITLPNGLATKLTYKSTMVGSTLQYRLQSVTRNDGFQLKYTYVSNATPSTILDDWFKIASIRAINNAIDYCDPSADACSFTQNWPITTQSRTVSGSTKFLTLIDFGGRESRFTMGIPTLSGGSYGSAGPLAYTTDQLLAIRSPTSTSADTIVYTYCARSGEYDCMHEGIKKLVTNGATWTYSGTSGSGGPSVYIGLTVTRPVGGTFVTNQQIGNPAAGPLINYIDGISKRTYGFELAITNRLYRVDSGDTDFLVYSFDSRSNIVSETHTPASSSSLTPLVRTANYESTCSNPRTCNQPNWEIDARGNQTDYMYDATHGGVTTITSPAVAVPPSGAFVRPQTRYGYTQRYAWYKTSSGGVVQSPTPIWLLTTERFCRQTAAHTDGSGCAVSADEVTTTYEYGPTSGANNLLLRGVAVSADGITRRTCYGYDIYGNRVSTTMPKAGLASCP